MSLCHFFLFFFRNSLGKVAQLHFCSCVSPRREASQERVTEERVSEEKASQESVSECKKRLQVEMKAGVEAVDVPKYCRPFCFLSLLATYSFMNGGKGECRSAAPLSI